MNRFKVLPPVYVLSKLAVGVLTVGVVQAQTLPPPPVSPAPVVRLEYDAQGNPTRRVLAPGVANFSTATAYDRLSRATVSTDARGKPTQMAYDGRENLLQVTDPRGLITQYPRTGLGDTIGLISPDTGAASQTVDAAGNVLTRTDSRGATTTYSYDLLNRPTSAVYSQGGQSQAFIWTYDQTGPGFSNGIGRLTSTQFPGGASSFSYDPQGRLTSTVQTVVAASTVTLGVAYGHDAAGHVTSITYPSGRVLYIPHVGGQPTSLSLAPSAGAAELPLLSGLQFEPGPGSAGVLRSWNWELNNGSMAHNRVFDVSGRMVRYPLGGAVRDITYDVADRIASYTHLDAITGQATSATQALNQFFSYDEVGRLTSVSTPGGVWSYGYDDNGNRTLLSYTSGGAAVSRAHTVDTASNRLLSIASPTRSFSYDAAGNITSTMEGGYGWTATVDPSGRVQAIRTVAPSGGTVSTVQYLHNAMGLRAAKLTLSSNLIVINPEPIDPVICLDGAGHLSPCPGMPPPPPVDTYGGGGSTQASVSSTGMTLQVSDPGGWVSAPATNTLNFKTVYVHGQQGELLGEYDGATGAIVREYIWLQGIPVAVVDGSPASPQIYYVQTDHVDTPRVLLDRAGRQRWSWVAEPFGNSAPVEDPVGFGAVKLNLRMPGQYYDEESGLSYNWNRSYDAGVGRYTQSDPIGLQGGINTYAYAESQPTSLTDPMGLATFMCTVPLHALGGEGRRSGPDVPGNLLYHQYVCVPDANGKMQCSGQDRANGAFGPGKPSDDKFKPESCEKVEDDNKCVEQCILSAGNNPRRPPYWLVGGGTARLGGEVPGVAMNCQQWADYQVRRCVAQCRKN